MSDQSQPGEPRTGWRPPVKSQVAQAVIIGIGVVAIIAILAAWNLLPFSGGVEVTDNAYVRGRTAVVSPEVSGYVVEVAVKDFQEVQPGQTLVRIDDRIYGAKVAQAKSNLDAQLAALANNQQARASRTAALASARAQLQKAKADMARVDDLVRDGSVSAREHDQTRAALSQAEAASEIAEEDIRTVDVSRGGLEAQVEAARAQLHLAQIDLDNTIIKAGENGQVSEIGARLGQYVTNGTQLLSLVPPDRWVIANYKETQTAHMAPAQSATLVVDALNGAKLKGHVEKLSPAAGSEFSVLKADNATGNFVKVPQRIGVRIGIDPNQPLAERLRPGMSVEARIDTSSTP